MRELFSFFLMKQAAIITHGEDTDGIVASALLTRFLVQQLNYPEPVIYPLHYFGLRNSITQITSLITEKDVYVLDLNLADLFKEPEVFSSLADSASNLTVIDHHPGTIQYAIDLLNKGVYTFFPGNFGNKPICTSGLVHHYFLSNSSYAKWLSGSAQANDFADMLEFPSEQLRMGEDIQSCINHYLVNEKEKGLIGFINTLSTGACFSVNTFNKEYTEFLQGCRQKEQDEFSNMLRNREELNLRGKYVTVSFCSLRLSPKQSVRYLLEKSSSEVGMSLNFRPTEVTVLKRNTFDFNVSNFCRLMGGGGREVIGGFRTPEKLTSETYPAFKNQVLERLNDYLSYSEFSK